MPLTKRWPKGSTVRLARSIRTTAELGITRRDVGRVLFSGVMESKQLKSATELPDPLLEGVCELFGVDA